jgi:hypothetical protein
MDTDILAVPVPHRRPIVSARGAIQDLAVAFSPTRGAMSRKVTGLGMRRLDAIKLAFSSLLVGDMGNPVFRKRG